MTIIFSRRWPFVSRAPRPVKDRGYFLTRLPDGSRAFFIQPALAFTEKDARSLDWPRLREGLLRNQGLVADFLISQIEEDFQVLTCRP